MSRYDNWLEEPYQRQADEDMAHEAFQESTTYAVALATWKVENGRHLDDEDYQASPQYADDFDRWMEGDR